MINPETLNIDSLPWMPLEEKSAFPKQSAIYFAIDSLGDIQYIGRSANVKMRWVNHHRFDDLQSIGNIRIAYLFMEADLLPSVEAALIEWFNPPLNILRRSIESINSLKPCLETGLKIRSRLPELMAVKQVTQKEIAAQTGINPNTLSKFYRNQIDRFDRKTVETLCNYFGCTKLDDLIQLVD